ncbi:MAG: hypothetical protein ACNA8R_14260 [Nitriliruptoraceae bacterium]
MRRLSALLAVVLAALLLLPGLALAAPDARDTPANDADAPAAVMAADVSILAVEGAPVGPEPAPRTQEDNPARDLGDYGDRETPFTWAAAWLLTGLGFVGVAVLLLIYRFRVVGPERAKASS